MRSFSADAGQRAQILDVLGQQVGKLAVLVPYWRVMEMLRITEAEATELSLRVEGQTILWDPTKPLKEFNLEDADAAALRACLESWEGFQPSQVPGMQRILQALTQTS